MTRKDVPPTDESESERWRRNHEELIAELRVVQTGNQILFAFLLTVAFSARIEDTTTLQRCVYVGTLLATCVATALIIAPVSHHRILFRQGAKRGLVRTASRMAAVGLVFVLLAMSGALFLAVDMVAGRVWAESVTAVALVLTVLLWYLVPLGIWRRHR